MYLQERQALLASALTQITLPRAISVRAWTIEDFPAIQRLSTSEGWTTPERRPEEALAGWQNSWPTLVAVEEDKVIGFIRAFTDQHITIYVAELLVASERRGVGVGRALLDVCHYLYPRTRIDVLSDDASRSFYEAHGFRYIGTGVRKSFV